MSDHVVASHLRIPLDEYDMRIRTFVPYYEEMLRTVAEVVDRLAPERPVILDLGIGTGALSAACLAVRPDAALVGIDADADILALARTRLQHAAPDLRVGNYLTMQLPDADVIVSSISLHHVRDGGEKRALYAQCRQSLRSRGIMVLADAFPPTHPDLAKAVMDAWRAHLEQNYTRDASIGYLEAWARDDKYYPLDTELTWLSEAGFDVDVVWRKELYAVLCCHVGLLNR